MGNYYIGMDIGTSGVRAVLFDENGAQSSMEFIECPVEMSTEGIAELDPVFVFNAVIGVLNSSFKKAKTEGKSVAGLGISCHMHSLMAVDERGDPLTRLIIWADTRAGKEAHHINTAYDVSDLYNRTGCRVQHPMYPLSKILWLRNNKKDIFEKAFKFITIKEFVLLKLYGEYVVDCTLASCQGYYNINTQEWDGHILENVLGIGRERLSTVVECTHVLTDMRPEYAHMLGVDRDFPVTVGSGDGIMANLGCGVYDGTSLSSTIGTSGAIRTTVKRPLLDPEQRTWCYSFTRDAWVAGGAINNGGIVLKWLRETFRKQFECDAAAYGESVYKLFDRYASEIPPGSEGLIFLPYLTGERSPDWNAGVRGLMYGLDYSHGKKHMVRAAMEGVVYRMYSVYEVMSKLNDTVKYIRANGGYTKSEVWLQIQADVFNKEILVSGIVEASALGAAFLSMVSQGAVEDTSRLLPGMQPRKVIKPIEHNHEIYRKAYELSKQVYGNVYYSDNRGSGL